LAEARVAKSSKPIPISDLPSRVIRLVRSHAKKAIALLLGSGILQLFVDYYRSKAMDYLMSQLGELGVWIVGYKFAVFTLVLIGLIIWTIGLVIRDSRQERESAILDHRGSPIIVRKTEPSAAFKFSLGAIVVVAILAYGTVRFYQNTPDALLRKYPLGYVIFKLDSRNEVFPYVSRSFLTEYTFDWNNVRVMGTDKNIISISLPNIYTKEGGRVIFDNSGVGVPNRVGPFNAVSFGSERIDLAGEILSITKSGIVFVFGFKDD
jgi:hypothetical protein